MPLDGETLEEMSALCMEATAADQVVYDSILNLPMAGSFESKGFMVLAYDDDEDKLVGAASAIDLMGLHTYEWSLVVNPTYRQLGIGVALADVLQEGLVQRGAEGQLALVVEGAPVGREFIEKRSFAYSFSEATLYMVAGAIESNPTITIQAYEGEQAALVEIYCAAFGDLPEEAEELIAFNTLETERKLWVARKNGELVGTVTTSVEDNAQWITALAVHPNVERQGVGSALLAFVKNYAYETGAKNVLLDVEIENNKALTVYEKAGFVKSQQIDYFAKI